MPHRKCFFVGTSGRLRQLKSIVDQEATGPGDPEMPAGKQESIESSQQLPATSTFHLGAPGALFCSLRKTFGMNRKI